MRGLFGKRLGWFVAAMACTAGTVMAQTPVPGADVIVGELPDLSQNAAEGAFDAFAVGTTSCNKGNTPLLWFTGGTDNRHPVIGQNLFRLHNGRFEHIGQAWLKHGFTALQGNVCVSQFGFGCSATSGTTLGTGCSDPYSSGLNNGQSGLGPKWQVNAANGLFPYPFASPSFSGSTARRLRVRLTDLDPASNAGARYFIEGQYVCGDDAAVGNKNNNASYREVGVSGACCSQTNTCTLQTQSVCVGTNTWLGAGTTCSPTTVCSSATGSCCASNGTCTVTARATCITGGGRWFGGGTCAANACAITDLAIGFAANATTQREKVAIEAWKVVDPAVTLVTADVPGDGRFFVACKVTQSGPNYTYEYAVHNLNSHRCAGSFVVPFPNGTSVSGVGFRDVEYHSGEPNAVNPASPAGDDWTSNTSSNQISWAGASYSGTPAVYTMSPTVQYKVDAFTAGTGNDHTANVLRWGTLFNFRFTTTVAPALGSVQVGLWRPGTPNSFSVAVPTPGGATSGTSTGPCCIGTACAITTPAACTGTFGLLGATCTPDPCTTGACCAVNGTCAVTTQASCSGGWTSGGTCSPNNCPAPTGACCANNGTCTVSTAAACGGTYRGDGVTCQAANCQPAAGNDLCSAALSLCDNVAVNGTTVGSTNDGTANCGNSGTSPDVWYRYVPATTGSVNVNSCGSGFDTVVSVYTGACNSRTQVACNDDNANGGNNACGGGLSSGVNVNMTAGTAYLIRMAGYNSATGTFTLRVIGGGGQGCQSTPTGACCSAGNCAVVTQANCTGAWTLSGTCSPNLCPPLNDDCNNRAGLGTGTQAFDTTNATTDGPVHAACLFASSDQIFKDIWFNHPASITGTLEIDTCGSTFDTKIAVYSGTGCADLATRLIACNDDAACPTGDGLRSRLTINIVAGQHYTIRIGGYNDAAGVGQVTLTATATPTGACCATDGSCSVTTQANCTGAWTTGGTCTPSNPCPQPTGACCNATTCSITTQAACAGQFQGVGTACGAAGNPTTCCPANFNGQAGVSVQDIFDFLAAYFANSPAADFNGAGGISVQDIFDFLAAYFTGCPG